MSDVLWTKELHGKAWDLYRLLKEVPSAKPKLLEQIVMGAIPEIDRLQSEVIGLSAQVREMQPALGKERSEAERLRAENATLREQLAVRETVPCDAEAEARGYARGNSDAVSAMKRTWEARCDDYEPWPEDSDDTASHVFHTLLDAVREAAVGAAGKAGG